MALLSTTCRQCGDDLQHCHGTVIIHAGQAAECTDEDCVTPEAEHLFRIDCDTVGCACGQPMGSSSATWGAASGSG
ncbi:MAG: hypothetical protein WCE30_09080 [Mycobacterium sp.]